LHALVAEGLFDREGKFHVGAQESRETRQTPTSSAITMIDYPMCERSATTLAELPINPKQRTRALNVHEAISKCLIENYIGRWCHRSCASTIRLQADFAIELQIFGCRAIGDAAVEI
jgi:hypothetical protein